MKRLEPEDIIEGNYIYARINVDDIPGSVLKQLAEHAYVEGWQDGVNRGINLSDDLSDAEKTYEAEADKKWREHYMQLYADYVNRWSSILNFEHPKNTPMLMSPDQTFVVKYNYYGNCIGYYYENREDYEPDPDKEPPIWLSDPDALEAMLDNYDPETGSHVEPTEAEKEELNARWVKANPAINAMMNGILEDTDD